MVAYFSDSLLFIFSEAVMGFCFVVFKAYIKLLIFFLKIYLLTFGCALLLHRLFLVSESGGYFLDAACGLLIVVSSFVVNFKL